MPETMSEPNRQGATPVFFPVSRRKLVVLSIFSLGIYEMYWFYKNWVLLKQRTRQGIIPIGRAIFAVIFCYDFFDEVVHTVLIRGKPQPFRPGMLALAYIGLTVCANLPYPFHLVALSNVFVLLRVQKVIDELNLCEAPHAEPNDQFSDGNIAIIVFGTLGLIWSLIGPFVLD